MVELFIEGIKADLTGDMTGDVTYSLADIRTPDKRQVNYSKTLNLPGTNKNNFIFGHIWNIDTDNGAYDPALPNVGVNFNPKKMAKAILLSDGVQIFDGTLRLWKIVSKEGYITYEVSLFGKLFDIFSLLGDMKLTDLDFSVIDHAYTWANIRATWDNSFLGGFRYPLLDYGYLGLNDAGQPSIYKFGSMVPCIEYRIYIDRIFSAIQSSYVLNLDAGDMALYNKLLVAPGKTTKITGRPVWFKAFHDIMIVNDWYEPHMSIGGWGIGLYGPVGFATDVQANQIFNVISGSDQGHDTREYEFHKTTTSSIQFKLDVETEPGNPAQKHKFLVQHYRVASNDYETLVEGELPILDTGNNSQIITLEVPKRRFEYMDKIGLVIMVNGDGFGAPSRLRFNSQSRMQLISPADTEEYGAVSGDTYQMSRSVPEGITCVDFIKDFIKLFNLQVTQTPANLTPDPGTDSNIVTFTPYRTFYDNDLNNVIDWTRKIDRAGEMVFTPVSFLTAKNYLFTWKADKDYWNDLYTKLYGEVYGQVQFIADTDIITNTQKVEFLFSPAIMQGFTDSTVVCPAIYSVENKDGVQTKKPGKFNPRLLIWGGMQPAGHDAIFFDEFDFPVILSINPFTFDMLNGVYPYAGHLDNPHTPTFDLNFGNTNSVLPTAPSNTFSHYWEKMIRAATDKDGKLVSCYALLKATDIEKLDFSKLYRVDDQWYRLNKVDNYNPFDYTTCKIEIIKVINL